MNTRTVPSPAPQASGRPGLFAEVVFDRPLDHAYTYAVPESLGESIAVGKRVAAPFGKGDKSLDGYCVGLTTAAPAREVKSVTRVLDDVALLDGQLLRLTKWMADHYLVGWGQVLTAVVPAGARSNAGTRSVVFVEAVPADDLPNLLPGVTPKQKLVLDRLKRAGGPMELNQLARATNCGTAVVAGLVGKGLIRRWNQRVDRFDPNADADEPRPPAAPVALNPAQQSAWDRVYQSLQTGDHTTFLLHGVTGSGKTEVYLRAIEEVVRQNKEAIVLVPEISLTPQTIERFRGRAQGVSVLHSHLTDAERGGHWRRIAAGQTQVVVGARSAVFAPTRRLGLIIIDEEHETSFKQESTPRYHARDVAVMRARLAGVPIVLGSATPSLESFYRVKRGDYQLLGMPKRVEDRPMPKVQLVDLKHEPKQTRKKYAVGPTLEHAMHQALASGGQVILLLNRRGYATHVHCTGCGHVAQCPSCDLALTFHRHQDALVCHHCGYESEPLQRCPKCQAAAIRYLGLGTEKLQQELVERFPDKIIQRMDSDTMARPGSHQRVLDAFRDGLIQILLGTQMIAKGLDFPNVTLVGVVNADTGLHMPDFRAGERTFQLLAQVAGRAGRGEKLGRVLVQTLTPEHYCIDFASRHDYLGFVEQELKTRSEHGYPPYHAMARVIVRSESEVAANSFATQLATAFRQSIARQLADRATSLLAAVTPPPPEVRVLGPAECPVFKLKNYYRFHFQLQSAKSDSLQTLLRGVVQTVKVPANVEFQIDIDPYNML